MEILGSRECQTLFGRLEVGFVDSAFSWGCVGEFGLSDFGGLFCRSRVLWTIFDEERVFRWLHAGGMASNVSVR